MRSARKRSTAGSLPSRANPSCAVALNDQNTKMVAIIGMIFTTEGPSAAH
jgi:hypothetical protein